MQSLELYAAEKNRAVRADGLSRSFVATDRREGVRIARNGRQLLSFSCNDYLGFTQNPEVKEAAIAAIRRYGVGAGASRLVTGNHPLLPELESRLARLLETEAACVFGSGYLANTGIVPALVGSEDLIVIDELAHGCLYAGARLAQSQVVKFKHNDCAHAEELLQKHRPKARHALILTDAVFSQDGDVAPLKTLLEIGIRHDAWLLSDDAHGIGVIGKGRGVTFIDGTNTKVPLKMGTLGKAIGSCGGFLCASAAVIEVMRNRARTVGHTTGLPPASVAACIAALDIIQQDPALTEVPLAKAKRFAHQLGLPDPVTPIIPIIIGSGDAALRASGILQENGVFAQAIRAPAVPAGTARLRLLFTSCHTDSEIDRLAALIKKFVYPLVDSPSDSSARV